MSALASSNLPDSGLYDLPRGQVTADAAYGRKRLFATALRDFCFMQIPDLLTRLAQSRGSSVSNNWALAFVALEALRP